MLWLNIWRNYSFKNNKHAHCLNRISNTREFIWDTPAQLKTHLTEPSSTQYFPVSFNCSLQNMKFVSCGGACGMEGILLSDFFNVFDVWVWPCTVILTCIVTSILYWTLNAGTNERHVISRVWHSVKSI